MNQERPADAERHAYVPSGPPIVCPPIIDIEASGFGARSYPIEVGVVMPDGEAYCSLIQPLDDWTHWDPKAEAVHRVSRAVLMEHGRRPDEVARQLNQQLRGRTVYCDAWYHDYTWLGRLFDAVGLLQAFRLEDIRTLLSHEQMACWDQAKQAIIGQLGMNRHRASNDARIIQLTLQAVHGPSLVV